jgi:hypothetical protein
LASSSRAEVPAKASPSGAAPSVVKSDSAVGSRASTASSSRPSLNDYLAVSAFLALFSGALSLVTRLAPLGAAEPAMLLGPMFALVALTALIWLLMVIVRNASILRGLVSARYFVDYRTQPPAEWTERPAATFNNLMQVPTLFYVVCLLMMQTGQLDHAQVWLAWIFPAARLLHAIAYIGWNRLPSRFASWVAGCITLGVIWTRFAIQAWPY